MKLSIVAGATSQSINIFIANSTSTTGAGLTGLVFNSSGLTAHYSFSGANAGSVAITLATLSLVTSAYSSGGFKEIDATNMPGWYRFDIPNAALATSKGRSVAIHLQGATNMAPLPIECELTGWDNQDAVHGGMSALPNTACTGNASLLTSGTGTDQVSVSAGKVLLQATQTGVTIPTVTTVTNQLTAAAIATGVWQDATAGDFTAASSIGKSLYTSGNAPGAASGLAIVGSNMGTVTSVTGSVGSVTGAVGSVTGAVGSVTGNVGGNVVGSVASVTAAVTLGANDSFTSQSGTAQAGAASTITLAAGASATDNLYNGQFVKINSGTGAGQARVITGYVGSTKVATVDRAWATNPDSTSVYTVVFADDATLNSSLQVTAASVQGNVTGSVASVTGAVGSVTGNVGGSVASVTAAVTLPSIPSNWITAGGINAGALNGKGDWLLASSYTTPPTTGQIATGVWQDATAGDFTTASSIGKALYTGNHAPGAASGLAIVGSQMDFVNAPNATAITAIQSGLATPTNITAGTITTVTNLTNAPTSGDLTSTMKTSVENAVWNATASSHTTAGSMGAELNAAGGSGDPWSTVLPGSYTSGQAGYIVGNNLNAAVTSRMATFTLPTNFSGLAIDVSGRVDLGKILGTASAGAAGYVGLDWAHINAPTTSQNLSGTTISTGQTITSVSGSVGSVTGAVGSVTGSVGSVIAAVTTTFAIKKNTALNNFEFTMYDGTDHVTPKTGLTVTGQVSIDGAAYANLTNAVTELSAGTYKVNLAAADLNGNMIGLKFAATGADTTFITIPTQS